MEQILKEYEEEFGQNKEYLWLKEKLSTFEKKTKEEFLKRILPEEMSAKTINHITWNDNFVKGFNCCIEEIKDNYKNI